jgi:hypothetical protein
MRVFHGIEAAGSRAMAGLLLAAAVGFAQSPGWRRADEPAPPPAVSQAPNQPAATPNVAAAAPDPSAPVADQTDPSTPVEAPDQSIAAAQNAAPGQNGVPAVPPPVFPSNGGLPTHLIIPAGTFINVRIDQPLSTDHNQAGDFFFGTLIDPVVVDGIVVAQRGQRVNGQVTQSDKGGRVSGVARLGLAITQVTAVDGQQIPIHTQFVGRNAPSTVGRDVGVVAGTTGLGAAVGAAAAWGRGAAIGAGAGAVLGIAGVLLSRGAPAVVYPETPLTFRMEQAATVDTQNAPQAFQPVNPNQYQYPPQYPPQTQLRTGPPPAPGAYGYGYGYGYPAPYAYAPYPYPYAYAYPYPYYPYYWGPSFGVVIGRGWYGGRWYGGFRR